ncbi:MAG TPA: iron-containing alcohol dehydrogenase [Kofleriaceae bacterium]|jgi:maleylacetate reductase|nr:iron-containing alcohol dehydrogenase [Kofleriaceae bacterium]
MAPEVIVARDGLGRLAARLAELGSRRALLLLSPSRRFADPVSAALIGLQPVLFDGARTHVPAEVVDRAAALLGSSWADTVVSVGGGSTIGLGKALRLDHAVRFAAVPTTYSGSEMTSVYGITRGSDKRTGRDPRVRPDLVLYDATLNEGLPLGLTVQSLMNGLSHVVGVLGTGSLAGGERAEALVAARRLIQAMEELAAEPADVQAREDALVAASAAGTALDRGKLGAQHALAHLLGGGLGLDHAALHAVLLPRTLARLRDADPALAEELGRAVGRHDLEGYVIDLLTRAGVPRTLDELGADRAAVARLVASRPDLAELVD